MLYPQFSPTSQSGNGREILVRMEKFYVDAITINLASWSEGDINYRFYVGDQSVWNDVYGNLAPMRRRQFSFNRIRPMVSMVSGHQRRTRKSIVVVPIENADNETADQLTKVVMWCVKRENILETISDAFEGALVAGMNLLHVYLDYRQDPISGNIKVDNCAYSSFVIDPYFKKHDLSDCNGIWKRTYLEKRECISLLPDKAEEIMTLNANESGSAKDGKFQFMAEQYGYGMKNLLAYDEFYYRDYRLQKLLVDTKTGESMEWRGEDDDALKLFLQTYPEVEMVEQEIPTVRLAIVIQNQVMFDGPNPNGIDQYNFVPVFCYYNPQVPYFPWRITSIVTALRDPQYLFNRRKVIELDAMESQINSGWIKLYVHVKPFLIDLEAVVAFS